MVKTQMTAQKVPSDITLNVPYWGYWAFNEGTGTAVANDSRSGMTLTDMTENGTSGWTRAGWHTGNGTDTGVTLTNAVDADINDLCDFGGNKSILIGFQAQSATSASRETILHVGGASTSNKQGVWFFKESNNRLYGYIKDTANAQISLQNHSSQLFDGSTDFNNIYTYDGSTDFAQIHQNQVGAIAEVSGTALSLAGAGTLTFSAQAGTPAINVHEAGGTGPNPGNADFRRLLIINFGAAGLPSNIDDIRTALYASNMLITQQVADLING